MKLAIGSDHAGFKRKSELVQWLRTRAGGSHQILDVGTGSEESCDYPDFARDVANAVVKKRAAKGILLCGSGIGMSIAANKVRGARAALAWNPKTAGLSAEHNGANILCVPARFVGLKTSQAMLKAFLSTPLGGPRHAKRIKKIMALEKCN